MALQGEQQLQCDVRLKSTPPNSHLPARAARMYTEFKQRVGVDLIVQAASNEDVFELLIIVDFRDDIQHLLSSANKEAR